MLQHHPSHPHGFTLLEMTILITVIGFVIGGIQAGKHLIRVAKLQAVMSDAEAYAKAIQQFKDKYNYLPGDMPTAQTFWGTSSNGCPNSNTSTTLQIATCSGDGNGQIYFNTGDITYSCEEYWLWQQLADAGMISGTYSGAMAPINGYTTCKLGNTQTAAVNINVPGSKIAGAGYMVAYWGQGAFGAAGTFGNPLPNQLGGYNFIIFSMPATAAAPTIGMWGRGDSSGAISGMDSFAIDEKIDDGLPGSGVVLSSELVMQAGANSHCVMALASATTTYAATNTVALCSLVFNYGL